jgi:hypothetical protein
VGMSGPVWPDLFEMAVRLAVEARTVFLAIGLRAEECRRELGKTSEHGCRSVAVKIE